MGIDDALKPFESEGGSTRYRAPPSFTRPMTVDGLAVRQRLVGPAVDIKLADT
jgi:hypothetical protein